MKLLARPAIKRLTGFTLLGIILIVFSLWRDQDYTFDIGSVAPPQPMLEGLYPAEQQGLRSFQQSKPTIQLWLPLSTTNTEVNLTLASNTLTPTLVALKVANQTEVNVSVSPEFRNYRIFLPNRMLFEKVSLEMTPFLEENSNQRVLGVAIDTFSRKILYDNLVATILSWDWRIVSRILIVITLWYIISLLVHRRTSNWFMCIALLLIFGSKLYSLYAFNLVIGIVIATSFILLLVVILGRISSSSHHYQEDYTFLAHRFQYIFVELGFWILITILMTYPLINQLNDVFPDTLDSYLNSWILAWDHHQLWRDPIHLFSTNIIYPYPYTLAQSEHLLGLYPITAPLFVLGLEPAMVHNLTICIGFILCGFGMSLLVRSVTGSRVAGIAAGLIYAFYPYRMVQMGHIQQMSAQWMPFTFWALEKFRQQRNWRYASLSGLFFLLQSLVSYYHAIFLGIMVLVYGIYFIVKDRNLRAKAPLLRLFAVGIVVVVIHIPLAQPYLYLQKLGFQRSADDSLQYSAALTDYLTPYGFNEFYLAQAKLLNIIAPLQTEPQSYLTKWQLISGRPTHETVLFVGIIPLLLAGLGIAQWRRHMLVSCMVIILAVCIICSFGPILRYDWSSIPLFTELPYKYLPINRLVRAPARFALGGIVAFAVLAGFGVARLGQWLKRHYERSWLLFNVCILLLLPLELHRTPVTLFPIVKPNIEVETWLSQHPSGLTAYVPAGLLEQDARYEFYSTKHFNPIMNGYSGYYNLPTFHGFFALVEPVPNQTTLRMLQGIGLKYFVTHTDGWSVDEQAEAARRLPTLQSLHEVERFGESVIYELTPDPWMEQIEKFVADKTLYVSDGGTLPKAYSELIALRFHQSVVAGKVILGYRQLEVPKNDNLPDYGIFGINEDPTLVGFTDSDIVWQNELFKLIKRP